MSSPGQAGVWRLDFDIEDFTAGLRIDRNQMRVDRRQIETVALNRQALVVAAAAGA